MEDLALHLLDVAENALVAGADRIEVRVIEEHEKDVLTMEIQDNGRGMDSETVRRALDPFYTTKEGKRTGLGLPLLAQAAREAGGEMHVRSEPGKGTVVRATFRLSHPDLKPVGDMLETMATLVAGHPTVSFVFEHQQDGVSLTEWRSDAAMVSEK